jgi:hypothetical protein
MSTWLPTILICTNLEWTACLTYHDGLVCPIRGMHNSHHNRHIRLNGRKWDSIRMELWERDKLVEEQERVGAVDGRGVRTSSWGRLPEKTIGMSYQHQRPISKLQFLVWYCFEESLINIKIIVVILIIFWYHSNKIFYIIITSKLHL